jgi:uncharacterized protein (TIGR02118 family)
MIKLAVFLNAREDLERERFWEWWNVSHKEMVRRFPGLRKYCINWAVESPFTSEGVLPWDGFAELWFDDQNAAEEAYRSTQAKDATSDTKAHTSRVLRILVEETEVVPIVDDE